MNKKVLNRVVLCITAVYMLSGCSYDAKDNSIHQKSTENITSESEGGSSRKIVDESKDSDDNSSNMGSATATENGEQNKSKNPYFYSEAKDEYIYSVEEFFFEEIEEVPVRVEYLSSYSNGDVYSIKIQYEDLPQSDYYGGDRYSIGPIYVTEEFIYVLPWRENIPTEEDFIQNGILICSADDGVYKIDEEIDDENGYRSEIINEGDVCTCYVYNPSQGSTFYWTYEWTRGKGLTYFSSGYGAMGDPIVIRLIG